mmetsp:Transcript_79923/g.156695  ORF Transcript_79923/g.156695 Transcript_79923/m.156695 type:complete len:210 (+) Transcript_79923:561-1190(+)
MVQRHKITQFFTAHDHQDAHALRLRAGDEVRPLVAPGPRLRGRTHQPRGLALVLRDRRRSSLPHHGHLLADGDRRLHDDANAGQPQAEAGLVHFTLLRRRPEGPGPHHRQRAPRQRRRRRPGLREVLAEHAAHRLWQPHKDAGDLPEALPRLLPHRGRVRARQGRLLLDHGPRRRRYQCVRPPDRQRGGRARHRRPRQGRRGSSRRLPP